MKTKFKELFRMGGTTDYGKITPLISFLGAVFLIFLWWLEARFEVIPTKIFPGPIDVISALGTLAADYNLGANAWFSIKMNLLAYLWAIGISIPVGLLMQSDSYRYLPLPHYLYQLVV